MTKKKAVAGLSRGRSWEDELSYDESSRRGSLKRSGSSSSSVKEPDTILSAAEQLVGLRNIVFSYLGLALMVAVIWDALHINLVYEETGSVWVSLYHNMTLESEHPLEEIPTSLRVRLLAIYLAEDVNATTLQPLYGARRRDTVASVGAEEDGIFTAQQTKRRVWTHVSCDPDGDGLIQDCDISAGWKYRWLLRDWTDLAVDSPDSYLPQRHEVPAGEYRFVVIQTCLQNLGNESTYAALGGLMPSIHEWRSAPPRYGGSCFLLTRPMETPLRISHGDDVLVVLSYDLVGSFRSEPTGDESPHEWECFTADPARCVTSGACERHCVRMPSLQPSWVQRKGLNGTVLGVDFSDDPRSHPGREASETDWFALVLNISDRSGPFAVPPPPPPPFPLPPSAPPSPPSPSSPLPPRTPPVQPVARRRRRR